MAVLLLALPVAPVVHPHQVLVLRVVPPAPAVALHLQVPPRAPLQVPHLVLPVIPTTQQLEL